MRDVKEVIKAMLIENTGRALGDSGDIYGRNYEKNQEVDFDKQPEVDVDGIGDGTTEDVCYYISVYHYLTKYLEFDNLTEDINDMLDAVRGNYDNDAHWSQDALDFVEDFLDNELDMCITEKTKALNTYNFDSHLSQGLQYSLFEVNDEYYALIQIHGGCDIRGGYTDAVCFKIPNHYGCLTMPMEDVYGSVDGVGVSNTYDGYYLYGDDDSELYEQYIPTTKDSKIELYLMDM